MTTLSTATEPAADGREATPTLRQRVWRICRNRLWLLLRVLTAVLLACCAVISWFYFAVYQPDRQSSLAQADTVVKAASAGTIAVLTYKPDTAQSDFAAAKAHLTGDFLKYYDQFTQQTVTPALQRSGVSTTATIVKAAVSDLRAESAAVLLFVNQSTWSSQHPDPNKTESSVNVGLRKVHGDWLISSFDPV
jgi:Mce-associated membrane protein